MAFMNTTSSIAMALAGKTASVDIPKPRSGFTPGGRDSARPGHPAMLPTPPNSISPTLPPQGFRRQGANHPGYSPLSSSHVESDVDLGDAADHTNNSHEARPSAHDLDSTGAITPGMLAKCHLPEIMLQHGPLAIRHLMGYLTTSVPGFSGIPPAKARRLVVAALEGRGSEDKSGGRDGDVIFEKVGWGRWDARRRGEPLRDAQHLNVSPPSSISNSFPQRGMQIPTKRGSVQPYGSSVTGDSAVFSYSEMDYGGHDISMLEHEADKMSLDGNEREYCSSSEAPDDEMQDEDWGEEDITDEEDWAQIGADALRARSLNASGGFVNGTHNSPQLRGGGPAASSLAKSAPRRLPVQQHGFTLPEGVMGDREERAAVEALLRLGSM
ncbi:protein STB3 [Aspergillus awamori]|uniref:Protein STB3 n=1 Tax=Aspergillus awamori TaxID=105351 RepID=A0A401KS70_ASPAW|nr:protein STB3 [Aspergillus awamori]GKZ53433.1 DNA-binding proteins Bright/BRCAA1/RBP1 and proteins containing BRIGHT domain [Aspergillus niger]GKZ99777.1 DNA-binding proteins Bright/BRCAA1/RBP1 and proteins containing BRIGHT domain [Aspergillus niger]GLA15774.1 DNA-binding proteins Bright/BRCAA1/RBP1 and proteins containing BRIGHT domain [Aspergillus niger]GLA43232.1 DNA-binding proteins Bright/BRCAA1/RBP1 and proteins containing BRIGHT domain [Aspergillus niger]